MNRLQNLKFFQSSKKVPDPAKHLDVGRVAKLLVLGGDDDVSIIVSLFFARQVFVLAQSVKIRQSGD
jgi:hypothetical protein